MEDHKNNKVNIPPLESLQHNEHIYIIAEELVKMKTKSQIIDEYSKAWSMSPKTIRAFILEAIAWIATADTSSREEMRKLNAERLESLFGEASSLTDKLKIINLLNKTYSIYDQNINIGNKDNEQIKFDVGV